MKRWSDLLNIVWLPFWPAEFCIKKDRNPGMGTLPTLFNLFYQVFTLPDHRRHHTTQHFFTVTGSLTGLGLRFLLRTSYLPPEWIFHLATGVQYKKITFMHISVNKWGTTTDLWWCNMQLKIFSSSLNDQIWKVYYSGKCE